MGSAAVRIEKLNGRVYDPFEERPVRAHASQYADSEQRNTPSFAEGAAIGVILLGVLLASKPTPGHNTPPVPQA